MFRHSDRFGPQEGFTHRCIACPSCGYLNGRRCLETICRCYGGQLVCSVCRSIQLPLSVIGIVLLGASAGAAGAAGGTLRLPIGICIARSGRITCQ